MTTNNKKKPRAKTTWGQVTTTRGLEQQGLVEVGEFKACIAIEGVASALSPAMRFRYHVTLPGSRNAQEEAEAIALAMIAVIAGRQ